jgi:hypothetical protein
MRRKHEFVLLISVVFGLLLVRPILAVVVLPKGATKPVMGYLVRQDDRTVVVREELPGGKSRETRFQKKDIEELIITVDHERLAALTPDKPELYREYAEELSEKQRDPEARDAAIRLYAIAAARGEGDVRRGALLGLVVLARNAEEERLFRSAAYLFDARHDPAVLAAASGSAARVAKESSASAESSWSKIVRDRGNKPLPELRLEKLTEFDPDECVFRGGKWVRP